MITEHDLDTAIAECQGKRNPDASTCIKLAAFYTIKNAMYGVKNAIEPAYSFAPAPETRIETDSNTEFARAIAGRAQDVVLPVIDELMSTLQVIQPKLYNAVMDKLT